MKKTFDGNLIIPEGTVEIAEGAFAFNYSIVNVTIPDSVTTIGFEAFKGCKNLVSVSFGPKSKLKTVEAAAFSGCSNLRQCVLPDGVRQIKNGAFYGCRSFVRFKMPSKTQTIFAWTFAGCENLSMFSMGEVTRIDENAFAGCTVLKKIRIPASVKRMGSRVFGTKASLANIMFDGSEEMWEKLAQKASIPKGCTVECKGGFYA